MAIIDRNVVLLVMDAFGDKVPGRTVLQKRLYFVSEMLGQDMGYRAHFYGPYADDVTNSIMVLKAANLVKENRMGFSAQGNEGQEVIRYDYELTEDGDQAVVWLKAQYPDEANKVKSIVNSIITAGGNRLNATQLSIAAKVHLIMKSINGTLSTEAIIHEASCLSWNITEEQVEQSLVFLRNSGLERCVV